MGFRGSFEHAFDDKGRVSVPARFRDEIRARGSDSVVITRAVTVPCLEVYPLAAWVELEEKFRATPQFDPRYAQLRRFYFSASFDCALDRQGRMSVPANLRDHAGITKDVRFVSDFNRFQLWDPQAWAQIDSDDARALRENPSFLAEIGI